MKPDARTLWVLFLSCASSALLFAQAPGQQQPPEFVKQGQQLVREGKPDEALALYRNTLQTSPDSLPANIAAGSVLDLMGRGEEARKYFSKAIGVADTPEHKAGAQRAMAMSYAFEGNCDKTIEYEQQVFDYYGSVRNFFEQGEIADELARVCIDSGALDAAEKWYKIGHEMGLKEPELKPARQDLWNFRWEHAQARIAARRADQAEAQKHVAAAKAILDKGTIPEQAQFFPYLEGYVAFYAGDYKTALQELGKSNQNDPFIQCMIGQTHEKLGEKDKAVEFYRKASTASSHNPPAAYAVPFARKKLGAAVNESRAKAELGGHKGSQPNGLRVPVRSDLTSSVQSENVLMRVCRFRGLTLQRGRRGSVAQKHCAKSVFAT
ncbi:MAG: tetratricopeptide repeat protein [Candidatus Sulfotelmatobacter sp.]